MAQAVPYTKLTNFTQYATNNSQSPYNPAFVDSEFVRVSTFSQNIQQNLQLLQRDDGALRGGVVTPDTLALSTLILLGCNSFTPRGEWTNSRLYLVGDIVNRNRNIYFVIVEHTSGNFDTDLAANRLMQVGSNFFASSARNITYEPDGGAITSSDVQNALIQAQNLIQTQSQTLSSDRLNQLGTSFTTTNVNNDYTISELTNRVDKTRIRVRVNQTSLQGTTVNLRTGSVTAPVFYLDKNGSYVSPRLVINSLIDLEYQSSNNRWIIVGNYNQTEPITQAYFASTEAIGGDSSVLFRAEQIVFRGIDNPEYFFKRESFATFSLLASGAGGIAIGETLVANDFVNVYVILHESGLLSTLGFASNTATPSEYLNLLPAGYLASCFLATIPVRTATAFEAFVLYGRSVTFARNSNANVALETVGSAPLTYTSIITPTLIPENAKTIRGIAGTQTINLDCNISIASSANAVANQINRIQIAGKSVAVAMDNFALAVPFSLQPQERFSSRRIYYKSAVAASNIRIEINGYDF